MPEWVSQEQIELNERMLANSENHFLACTKANLEFSGVRMIDAFRFKSVNSDGPIKRKDEGKRVIVHFDNGVIKNAKKLSMVEIDGKIFIGDLYLKVKEKGALLVEHRFD